MKLQRWIVLFTLAVMALGPGLFWSPKSTEVETGFSQGWTAIPLPQQLLEAKTKLSPFSFGLLTTASGLAFRTRFIPSAGQIPSYKAPLPHRRLYLEYARLQTDGG